MQEDESETDERLVRLNHGRCSGPQPAVCQYPGPSRPKGRGVGDRGTVVDILQAPGLPDKYVVEASGPDGITVWLGDFTADELAADT